MPTEKLYYNDAYISEFYATVISCKEAAGAYEAVLDKTAFFPEAGGQSSDRGRIAGADVLSVRIENGVIYHKVNAHLTVGESVLCRVDFEERLEKMRAHTAEHILSGIIYKKYGFENVGFHLGADVVTFDTGAPLEREALEEIEALANKAVMKNAPIRCYFPTPDEREGIFFRSKSEIEDDLRIVEIEGYDSCACCAPHVKRTGEIGLIKIIYSERHKGGTRIYMLAGRSAYEYAAGLYKNAMKISSLLCAPVTDIAEETERLYEAKEQALRMHKQTMYELALSYAASVEESQGNAVFYYPALDADAIRIFINKASKKIKGLTVALTGEDGSLKYIIKSESDDVSAFVKAANEALCGKGGGRGSMAQGSFAARVDEVKKYFIN